MKESEWEPAKFVRQGAQDATTKKRNLWNSKAGRAILLGLFAVVCFLAGNSRFLYTSLYPGKSSNTGPTSRVEERIHVVEQGEFTAQVEVPSVRNDAAPTDVDKANPDDELEDLDGEDDPQSKEKLVEDNVNDARDAKAEVDDDAKSAAEDVTEGDDDAKTPDDVKAFLADGTLKEEANDSENDGARVQEETKDAVELKKASDVVSYLTRLTANLTKTGVEDNGPYHNRRIFEMEYAEMKRSLLIFIYPFNSSDPFANIYTPIENPPSGNYASEEFFQQALSSSGFVTKNASEAHFFFLPVSITKARLDKRIQVEGLQAFCAEYVTGVREQYGHWNRSNGADHFYLSCHSIARGAMDEVPFVRGNAIQMLCPSSYYLQNYITHKDASVPQIWPRPDVSLDQIARLDNRTRLAFFAGATNSPVRQELVRLWEGDDRILVHKGKVPYPYSEALMTSKFCLQAKGFEVNTARLGDSMFYGCVPVVIADQYDLPWQDILDWTKFSIVVAQADIHLLKTILEGVSKERYAELHRNLMLARKHFIWHNPGEEYDAFFTVMSELWKRRHLVRRQTPL